LTSTDQGLISNSEFLISSGRGSISNSEFLISSGQASISTGEFLVVCQAISIGEADCGRIFQSAESKFGPEISPTPG
jgi:hypothetical protein